MEQSESDSGIAEEAYSRFFDQALDLWITPEVERRQAEGRLPAGFKVHRAQVILNLDQPTVVRLNDEVQAVAEVRARGPMAEGAQVSDQDIEQVVRIELTDLDPNAGHFTMLRVGDQWAVAFDFRYNAGHVAQRTELAQQFLEAAGGALDRGHLGPFVENLYAAVELLAKAGLIMHDEQLLGSKSHGVVISKFNRWGHLGNTDQRFVRLLNRAGELRPAARYLNKPLRLDEQEARQMLRDGWDMHADVVGLTPKRHPLKERPQVT